MKIFLWRVKTFPLAFTFNFQIFLPGLWFLWDGSRVLNQDLPLNPPPSIIQHLSARELMELMRDYYNILDLKHETTTPPCAPRRCDFSYKRLTLGGCKSSCKSSSGKKCGTQMYLFSHKSDLKTFCSSHYFGWQELEKWKPAKKINFFPLSSDKKSFSNAALKISLFFIKFAAAT